MTDAGPVSYMWLPDAAIAIGIPTKTVYRWSLRQDVRRFTIRGRVFVHVSDLETIRDQA